jgi:hypothetical protein
MPYPDNSVTIVAERVTFDIPGQMATYCCRANSAAAAPPVWIWMTLVASVSWEWRRLLLRRGDYSCWRTPGERGASPLESNVDWMPACTAVLSGDSVTVNELRLAPGAWNNPPMSPGDWQVCEAVVVTVIVVVLTKFDALALVVTVEATVIVGPDTVVVEVQLDWVIVGWLEQDT